MPCIKVQIWAFNVQLSRGPLKETYVQKEKEENIKEEK